MCFPIRHGKRLGEMLKLSSLGSFKVSTGVSKAATPRLGLVSNKILNVSVSSRSPRHGSLVSSRLRRSRAHPCKVGLNLKKKNNTKTTVQQITVLHHCDSPFINEQLNIKEILHIRFNFCQHVCLRLHSTQSTIAA